MANKLEETTQIISRLANNLTNKLHTNRTNWLIRYIGCGTRALVRLSLWLLVPWEVHC